MTKFPEQVTAVQESADFLRRSCIYFEADGACEDNEPECRYCIGAAQLEALVEVLTTLQEHARALRKLYDAVYETVGDSSDLVNLENHHPLVDALHDAHTCIVEAARAAQFKMAKDKIDAFLTELQRRDER